VARHARRVAGAARLVDLELEAGRAQVAEDGGRAPGATPAAGARVDDRDQPPPRAGAGAPARPRRGDGTRPRRLALSGR